MPKRSYPALLSCFAIGLCSLPCCAQSTPPDASPTLTLQANSRIVLTDVTVTDRNGNPIHHLPRSAFHIFDNNQPQDIASFEEHIDDPSSLPPASPSTPAGVFSNAFFQHLPPVLNAVVLDTTNMELPDQMYLAFQLQKFVNGLAPGQPIAIFERHSDNTVLLQNFTADHALLLAAVRKALPKIEATGREYRSDTDTLHQIAAYLAQVPGRKNILWFSGGSTFFLLEGLTAINAVSSTASSPNTPATAIAGPSNGEDLGALREAYDELEAARIAVYPIDARGLTTENNVAYGPQQSQMNDVAESTGGHAFFNTNNFAQVASHIVATDSSAYSISYSPRDFTYDNKWHKIKVTVAGGDYTLNYRRGYFADQPHTLRPGTENPHPLILAGDTTATAIPDVRSSPILFDATVRLASQPLPASKAGFVPLRPATPPQKGLTAFAVDYSLSTSALTSALIDGAPRATVAFAIIAFDHNGERVGRSIERVRFPLSPDGPPKQLRVEQQIDLQQEKGEIFLSLVVWDTTNGRLGTLQIPIQDAPAAKPK